MRLVFDKKRIVNCGKVYYFPVIIETDFSKDLFVCIDGVEGACLNCTGKDYLGNDFKKLVKVEANIPKRVWVSVKTNANTQAFICVEDSDGNLLLKERFLIEVDDSAPASEIEKLEWLNSDYAIDDEVAKPFIPLKEIDGGISLLGREIEFGENGLPLQIKSYFNQSGKITRRAGKILSKPITFYVDGQNFIENGRTLDIRKDKAIIVTNAENQDFYLQTNGTIEFDGFARYEMKLTAKNTVTIKDAKLSIPLAKRYRTYFIGLGKKGDSFDERLNWKWNKEHQDAFWCGDTDGGLRVSLQGANYQKPLVNIYYVHKPLNIPESWGNGGKGGIKYTRGAFVAYSGKRTIETGQTLHFNVEFMVTPFKEIDLKKQLTSRYFHTMFESETWLKRAKEGGANVINVHHGNDLNPFINYPFIEEKALAEFVRKCHRKKIKTKIYYTIRELTINIPEFTALRDLDYEIFQKSDETVDSPIWQGEARSWIKNKLGSDVIPAWRQPLKGKKYKDFFDSAIITDGQSRLCNFYIEGLRYLIEKTDIDGIYVDDIAYDRNTMKRVRKTLDVKGGAYIDFHTWDHFNAYGGMVNCAVLYAPLFPYVDKLWVGEGFNYNYNSSTPQYWLTEISGIPFGVMSEMMDDGNAWKGLAFGMTSRLGWIGERGNGDPRNVWELISRIKLEKYEFVGWWDRRNPIKTSDENLRATVYKKGGKMFAAFANFSSDAVTAKVSVKGRENAKFTSLYIRDLQDEGKIFEKELTVEANGGLFVEII